MQLPYSEEIEQAVLGCMFLDEDSAKMAHAVLNSGDFFIQKNKMIFDAIDAVLQAGKIADIVTVSDFLKTQNNYEKVGGLPYFVTLATCVSTSVRTKDYVRELKEKTYFRQKVQQGREMMEAAYAQDKQKLQKINLQVDTQTREGLEAVPDVLAKYILKLQKQHDSKKSFAGISTGFFDLDFYIGGLQEGNLIIVAGRPAMGKTAFALDLLRNSVKHMEKQKFAIFFSLEMDRDKISARMFSAENFIHNRAFSIRINDEKEWTDTIKKIQQNAKEFEQNAKNIYIDDTPGITLEEIYEKCHNQQMATGKKLGFVVVDYLQIMGVEKSANRAMDVAYLSMGLKNLSRQFHCPVVALSQLSRENEKRGNKKPTLSDLRDSGAIEQDADIVLMLYREKYYHAETQKGNLAEVIIAKNRNGATGSISLQFYEEYTTFRNLSS